ncbi:MAG TPA: hypothetical protein VFE96_06815, partial [Candidatus Bathyarchaeia archaeon]|nr:hypothetical protein [Candidatus Bathyarchaeia archaeon]
LQFTAYPNPLNVTRGSFATVTVTFASQNGLSGNFSLSVSPCGPYGTNWCVPSGAPATILVGVNAPATFQVTISTTTAFNGGVEYFGVGTPLGSTRFYLPVNAA